MRTPTRLALMLILLLVATAAHAGGNANFLLGQRNMNDKDTFKQDGLDLSSPTSFGADIDFGGKDWPVNLVAGLHVSAEQDTDAAGFDVTVAIADVAFGVNWTIVKDGKVRPYLGAGLSSVGVAVDDDVDDDADQSLGYWAHGGVLFRLGSRLNIGLDARILRGTDLTVFDTDFDADYEQYSAFLGFGW